jgi:hypothetical protein
MIYTDKKRNEMIQKAADFAKFKAQRTSLEHYRKILKARLMKKAMASGVKTAQAQEREAYCTAEYEQIVEAIEVATEQETRLYWELNLFQIEVNVWRTEEASRRKDDG